MLRERSPWFRIAMLGALLALGLLLALPSAADAATITVTSNGEEQLNNGLCTLLEALNNANNDALSHPDCLVAGQGGGIVDRIEFNIPPSQCISPGGVCSIAINSTYTIIRPVTIDGYTQPNARPNTLAVGSDAVLRIQLVRGSGAPYTPVRVLADDVTLRGLVIGGFDFGIYVEAGANTRIVGCVIGADATGTLAVPNVQAGIFIEILASNTVIGGRSPADRNVISGNDHIDYLPAGIFVGSASGVTIQGNYIGLTANGLQRLPNTRGIRIRGASTTTIGGTEPGAGNVISGNVSEGIAITNTLNVDTVSTRIQGNVIGNNAAGVPISYTGVGVRIQSTRPQFNLIGGTEPGAGNRIAGNYRAGVLVVSGTGNQILGNSIENNGSWRPDPNRPGIDLNGDGVTLNDQGDGDSGPSSLQNFPVLTSVAIRANTTIHGTLNSTPSRSFRVEFFSNRDCDIIPGGGAFGEGETFVGFVNVTTDSSGNASFVGTFPLVPVDRRIITATATDLTTNDTSEFSACIWSAQPDIRVTSLLGSPITSLTTTEADEGGAGDVQFQVSLTTTPTGNVTIPISTSDSTEGAVVFPTSQLTFTPANGTSTQQVRIVGVDDGIDDGNVAYAVVLGPVTSSDANYNGLDPADIPVTNIDNDEQLLQCTPRPKINVSVARIGGGQLRATVTVNANPLRQNEIQSIRWDRLDTSSVVLTGVGPVQQGQTSAFGPLTQSASFVITRTPGAQSGTVRLTVTDACGAWPTFVGAGPNGW